MLRLVSVAVLVTALLAVQPTVPDGDSANGDDSGIPSVWGGKKSTNTAGIEIKKYLADYAKPLTDIGNRIGQELSNQVPDFDVSKVVKSEGPPPVCTWQLVDPATEPHAIPIPFDLTRGHVEKKVCGSPEGDGTGLGAAVVDWTFVENDAPAPGQPAAPVVDVQALAQQAYRELQVPTPTIGIGPDRSTVAVQLPTWLWVDDPGTLTAVAATGGVTVTATATLTSTRWTLGEPARHPDFTGFRAGPAVTLTCQGAGTPPPASVDWKAEPACGHIFRWRSTPDRTGGTGKWPLTATTIWAVTWTATTGQTGALELTATGTDAVSVSEYRILLTPGR